MGNMKRAAEDVLALVKQRGIKVEKPKKEKKPKKLAANQKRQVRRKGHFEVANKQRVAGKQELAYNSRPFVLCSLPVRKPPAAVLEYVRTNGRFLLKLTGDQEYGLPFGQDRLILIWVATLAVKQNSRTVSFRSAAELLRAFNLPLDGKTYKRIVEGFKRIATSKITFRTDESNGPARPWEIYNLNFFSRVRLWYKTGDNVEQETLPDDQFANVVKLSEEFWEEIQNHKIPIELPAIRALADSPANLDLYCWIVWRCWTASKSANLAGVPTRIPLESLQGQLGVSERRCIRGFRWQMRDWLKKIENAWPACPAHLSKDGDYLEIEPGRAIIDQPERQLP